MGLGVHGVLNLKYDSNWPNALRLYDDKSINCFFIKASFFLLSPFLVSIFFIKMLIIKLYYQKIYICSRDIIKTYMADNKNDLLGTPRDSLIIFL